MYAPVLHFKDTINETISGINDAWKARWKERTRSLISLLIIGANNYIMYSSDVHISIKTGLLLVWTS